MADFQATALRGGQVNAAGDAKALFLKQWSGEVLAAFEDGLVFNESRHMVRTIASGKSSSFPMTGRVFAKYHTPGAELVGQTGNVNERIISIDDLLVADIFFPKIDEAMSHYDYRAPFTQKAGYALAAAMDKNVAAVGILAARSTAAVTGEAGGTVLTNAAYGTDSAVLAQGIWAAAQTLDEKFIPEMSRAVFLRPAQYYILAQNTVVLQQDIGGAGSYSDGKILRISGIEIVKTNNLPSTNITSTPINGYVTPAAYQGNFSTTVGLIMTPEAVGTVRLMDLHSEMEYQMRFKGTLVTSEYALGHGVLRADCAIELKTA